MEKKDFVIFWFAGFALIATLGAIVFLMPVPDPESALEWRAVVVETTREKAIVKPIDFKTDRTYALNRFRDASVGDCVVVRENTTMSFLTENLYIHKITNGCPE